MGLSSSKTTTKSNTSQNTNNVESGTTTPMTPEWLSQAAQDYVGRIGSFGDMDPNAFVAPSSPLQNMAWQNAGSLGDWRGQAATASQMADRAGSQGPNLAGPSGAMGRFAGLAGLTPNPQMSGGGSAQMPGIQTKTLPTHPGELPRPQNAFSGASSQQPSTFTQPAQQGGPAYQTQATGYDAPRLGQANLVSGQGYSAPQLGNTQGYAAARVGSPIGAQTATTQAPTMGNAQTTGATGYNPNQVAGATINPTTNATASGADAASLLTNLNAYQNPWQDQVVNASMADFDNQAAQQRAALEARGARAGAFGGSRFGIAEGQMEGDLARGRATLESGLLSQGFQNAAQMSQSDAANRQQASLFNAQNQTGVSEFNAGASNARDLAQAGFDMTGNLANQAAGNEAASAFAQAQNQAGMFNTQSANSRADLAAQLEAQARGQNAAAFNANSQFNAAAGNQANLAQAGLDTDASRYMAEAGNQRSLAQGGFDANAGQFNAGQAQQAALANQSMLGQYALAQGGFDANAGQFNAANMTAVSGQNAAANNNMSQFNASQQDSAANRQLQAAGMLGGLANDYGSGTRADLGTMAQLGDQQRAIEQAYAMAGPAQLQLMGQLSGMTPYDILVGRQVNGTTNGTMTGTGTSTVTQSPSLMSMLMDAGNNAARAYAGGMGG